MKKTLLVVLALVGACGGKKDDKKAEPASAGATAPKPDIVEQRIAFGLGAKVALLEMYATIKKPEKATDALETGKIFAEGLHVTAPTLPGPGDHPDVTLHDELAKKKSPQVAAAFDVGYNLNHAMAGTLLGANVTSALSAIETSATKAAIPESVWRDAYDALKGKPTSEAYKVLARQFDAYFKG